MGSLYSMPPGSGCDLDIGIMNESYLVVSVPCPCAVCVVRVLCVCCPCTVCVLSVCCVCVVRVLCVTYFHPSSLSHCDCYNNPTYTSILFLSSYLPNPTS